MVRKENRLYASDSFEIAIARVIFIKWMRKNGKWAEYMKYMKRKASLGGDNFYTDSWLRPKGITDFLGNCSFDYSGTYCPWVTFCKLKLEPAINKIVDEFVF